MSVSISLIPSRADLNLSCLISSLKKENLKLNFCWGKKKYFRPDSHTEKRSKALVEYGHFRMLNEPTCTTKDVLDVKINIF